MAYDSRCMDMQGLYGWLMARLPKPLQALALRFDRSPLSDTDSLFEFCMTRSAYVSQTALYGYLRTRMGTRHRELFQQKQFASAIQQAAAATFAACLADLSIHVAARCMRDTRASVEDAKRLAVLSHEYGMRRALAEMDSGELPAKAASDLAVRLDTVDWARAAACSGVFVCGEVALLAAAPVSDEFKRQDALVVRNSVRNRWGNVIVQLKSRLDPAGVMAALQRTAP